MCSNEEININCASKVESLYKKSPYVAEWDEKSPESSSASFSPGVSRSVTPPTEVSHGATPISALSVFVPTMVQYDERVVSFEVRSPSDSVFTEDSLEASPETTSETQNSEEQTESEVDSFLDTLTSEQELDKEETCGKEDGNPCDYLDEQVFPVLLPCLEKMLFAAKENDVLKVQKSRFNGLDYLAELLWNYNPLHPERHGSYLPLFSIPFVQEHLQENPRPIIPQSWQWSRDQAAIVLQAAVRGFLVRCQPEIQELRQFWKTLASERLLSKQSDQDKPDSRLGTQSTVLSEGRFYGDRLQGLQTQTGSIYSFFSQYLDRRS